MEANGTAGITTRSRSKAHSQSQDRTIGTNGNVNGVISNGFHGYKEGLETLEKTGINRTIRSIINTIVVPLCMLFMCPQLAILYWYTNRECNGSYSEMISKLQQGGVFSALVKIWSELSIINSFTVSVVFGYLVWAVFWMKVLPGKRVYGPVTPNGNTPVYVDNGFLNYTVTMIGFLVLTCILKMYGLSPSVVYDRFGELIACINVFAGVFVFFLTLKGIYAPSSSDSGKTGGGFIFDYYWGTELYPRVFGIDIKVLTNCRFGMQVWPILVCIYALKSYELYGFVDSMFVSSVLQLVYITKFFTWESGYMSTIDIILDRAGFYICWGCLVWVPSLYALVSQYLVSHPVRLGPVWSSVILGLGLLSILINYLADLQRQTVRSANGECLVWGKRPDIIRAKYTIQNGEERESILLASGWWGMSRHFHYIPEIMLAIFWTIPAGFDNILPYSYLIFLTILLIHRSFRDENKCSKKYGPYWVEYCSKVKHRIVPFLF